MLNKLSPHRGLVKYTLLIFVIGLLLFFLIVIESFEQSNEPIVDQIKEDLHEASTTTPKTSGNNIPEIWEEYQPTFIEGFGSWGFQYPEDYVVSGKYNVYVFPKRSLDNDTLNIIEGPVFYFHPHSYTDGFSMQFTKDTGEDFHYSLWTGSVYEEFATDIYENEYTNYLTLQGKIDSDYLGERYQDFFSDRGGLELTFTASFQNVSQLEDLKYILSTFVSDRDAPLDLSGLSYMYSEESYPIFLANIPKGWKYFDDKRISYTYYYPPSFQTSVRENDYLAGNYQLGVGALSLNDNPEYVGFSTSGALCANTRCYTVGLYALPGSTDLLNVAQMTDGSVRGVHYGKDVSVSFSLNSDEKDLLDTYAKIIQSIKVSPDWSW